MCTQCVAQALPYVGFAVGGLKAMTWRAGRTTPRFPAGTGARVDGGRAEGVRTGDAPSDHSPTDDAAGELVEAHGAQPSSAG